MVQWNVNDLSFLSFTTRVLTYDDDGENINLYTCIITSSHLIVFIKIDYSSIAIKYSKFRDHLLL